MIARKSKHAKGEMLVNRATSLWRVPLVHKQRIGKTARDRARSK